MKTTLVIKDEILRRAKARAALAGKSLGRFVEESLLRALEEPEPEPQTTSLAE